MSALEKVFASLPEVRGVGLAAVVVLAILVRVLVSFGSYSGMGKVLVFLFHFRPLSGSSLSNRRLFFSRLCFL